MLCGLGISVLGGWFRAEDSSSCIELDGKEWRWKGGNVRTLTHDRQALEVYVMPRPDRMKLDAGLESSRE
jgi:hypothetical protein